VLFADGREVDPAIDGRALQSMSTTNGSALDSRRTPAW
jgi:hypothetical protein